MRAFLTGLCTLHWGRMEYGNVGNYYIIEPFVRQLHRVFPDLELYTTFQMSDDFCRRENVTCVPMEEYYNWEAQDLPKAFEEYGSAVYFSKTGELKLKTPYIEQVLASDLVIDLSGDMWGDNADLAGKNRFLVALLKDKTAQLLGKKTVMLAGSPGPFDILTEQERNFVKDVYEKFDYVTNREPISTQYLSRLGFDLSHTRDSFCPAFIFEKRPAAEIERKVEKFASGNPVLGVSICGFNFIEGNFNTWPRKDEEYEKFALLIEKSVREQNAKVLLLSHNNGFVRTPEFQLQQGRDYFIMQQLYKVLIARGVISQENILLIEAPLLPWEVKTVIGLCDVYISGRAHGAVAALSQNVPCLLIDYQNGPSPLKLRGFATDEKMERYVVKIEKIETAYMLLSELWTKREELKEKLSDQNIKISSEIQHAFDELRKVMG